MLKKPQDIDSSRLKKLMETGTPDEVAEATGIVSGYLAMELPDSGNPAFNKGYERGIELRVGSKDLSRTPAWKEGYEAGKIDAELSPKRSGWTLNPYRSDTEERREWDSGYLTGLR